MLIFPLGAALQKIGIEISALEPIHTAIYGFLFHSWENILFSLSFFVILGLINGYLLNKHSIKKPIKYLIWTSILIYILFIVLFIIIYSLLK